MITGSGRNRSLPRSSRLARKLRRAPARPNFRADGTGGLCRSGRSPRAWRVAASASTPTAGDFPATPDNLGRRLRTEREDRCGQCVDRGGRFPRYYSVCQVPEPPARPLGQGRDVSRRRRLARRLRGTRTEQRGQVCWTRPARSGRVRTCCVTQGSRHCGATDPASGCPHWGRRPGQQEQDSRSRTAGE
jgi:hypothetical protein